VTRDDLVWLAGYLEGEGCFRTGLDSHGSRRITISVNSTDEDVLSRAAALLGNRNVYKHQPKKANWSLLYETAVSGKAAAELMIILFPLMGKRRKLQIAKAIKVWSDLA
jgi:hypothetical protein